jgi:hypothetical protein
MRRTIKRRNSRLSCYYTESRKKRERKCDSHCHLSHAADGRGRKKDQIE